MRNNYAKDSINGGKKFIQKFERGRVREGCPRRGVPPVREEVSPPRRGGVWRGGYTPSRDNFLFDLKMKNFGDVCNGRNKDAIARGGGNCLRL